MYLSDPRRRAYKIQHPTIGSSCRYSTIAASRQPEPASLESHHRTRKLSLLHTDDEAQGRAALSLPLHSGALKAASTMSLLRKLQVSRSTAAVVALPRARCDAGVHVRLGRHGCVRRELG